MINPLRKGNNVNSQKHNAWKQKNQSELLDKVIDVSADFIGPLLVEEVTNTFHYYYILQKWNILLKPTVYVFLGTKSVISKVQVTHNKLNRYFHLHPLPRCSELPVPAEISATLGRTHRLDK